MHPSKLLLFIKCVNFYVSRINDYDSNNATMGKAITDSTVVPLTDCLPQEVNLCYVNSHEQVLIEKKEAQKRFSMMMENHSDLPEEFQNSLNFEAEARLDSQIEDKHFPESEFRSELCQREPTGGLEFANPDSLETRPDESGPSPSPGGESWKESRTVAQALEAVNQRRAAEQILAEGKNVIASLRVCWFIIDKSSQQLVNGKEIIVFFSESVVQNLCFHLLDEDKESHCFTQGLFHFINLHS